MVWHAEVSIRADDPSYESQPTHHQVPGPAYSGAVWRVHQGEDQADRGDQAAVGAAQGGGGADQVSEGVHRQQRDDHLIVVLIRAVSSDSHSHC